MDKTKLEDLFHSDYREPFVCPYHSCKTDNGWCWECAVETYGYEDAKLVHDGKITVDEGKRGSN